MGKYHTDNSLEQLIIDEEKANNKYKKMITKSKKNKVNKIFNLSKENNKSYRLLPNLSNERDANISLLNTLSYIKFTPSPIKTELHEEKCINKKNEKEEDGQRISLIIRDIEKDFKLDKKSKLYDSDTDSDYM